MLTHIKTRGGGGRVWILSALHQATISIKWVLQTNLCERHLSGKKQANNLATILHTHHPNDWLHSWNILRGLGLSVGSKWLKFQGPSRPVVALDPYYPIYMRTCSLWSKVSTSQHVNCGQSHEFAWFGPVSGLRYLCISETTSSLGSRTDTTSPLPQ